MKSINDTNKQQLNFFRVHQEAQGLAVFESCLGPQPFVEALKARIRFESESRLASVRAQLFVEHELALRVVDLKI